MLTAIILLGIVCALLTLVIHFIDNSNTRLSVDNSLMKTRMESLQEKIEAMKAVGPDDPLTLEGVKEAIRYHGFFPREVSDGVLFKDSDDIYDIDTGRLPVVFINHHHHVNSDDFDIDLFAEAAHQVADDLIMVKADVEPQLNEIAIRYYIAALDANNASFRENLPRYVDILHKAELKMVDIYLEKKKEKDKEEEEQAAAPDPADRFREHKKVFS